MKIIYTFLVIIYALPCICIQTDAQGLNDKTFNKNRIQPYSENPRYWQYKGKPVLLLGGSDDDNLFQWTGARLIEQLDLLKSVGGNYVRCTMSGRDEGNVWQFKQVNDKYDLDQWNNEYWRRFENFIKQTHDRDIIVQVEIWATYDFYRQIWQQNPFNPKNNINYTAEKTGLSEMVEHQPGQSENIFFESVPAAMNQKIVLNYQQRFVDKMLSISLKFGNVLYTMDNETAATPQWGKYWSEYVKAKAKQAGVVVQTTEMWYDHLDKDPPIPHATFDDPSTYSFVDVSQNSHKRGQRHWESLRLQLSRVDDNVRPLTNVKIYGADTGPERWFRADVDGVERFWRNIFGGMASARFHRPTAGLGLGEKAQANIQSLRMITDELDIFTCSAHNDLIADRKANEAYCLANPGNEYAIYFPDSGEVKLDMSLLKKPGTIRWLEISTSKWGKRQGINFDQSVTLRPPNIGPYVALLTAGKVSGEQPGAFLPKRNLQSQGLTITNKGTDNPTILYNGKPMLRAGSVSEQGLFAFPWESSHSVFKNKSQTHEQWALWQRKSGMGFARAYPESGYIWMEKGPESEKIYPWNVVSWKDDHPVVDLTVFDSTYWKEFATTICKCKEKDIVLVIQLYQACYFLGYFSGGFGAEPGENELTWWQTSYFHPDNNVNKWPIGTIWTPTGQPCGMDFPQRVVDDYPDGPWWILHKTYVNKILDAIGDQGHVIIDLGNEVGYRSEGLHCYEWVERTLDIIEQWEKQHAVDILVGMDEHFWFRVPAKHDWVRKHRRLEVLIAHGAKDVVHEEGYDFKQGNTPRHPGKLRVDCRKPCISIHNQSERVKAEDRHAGFQRLYQWLAMMQKVQGIASYGYGKFIDDPTQQKTWESQTRFMMDFYSRLRNYADLTLSDASIASVPEQCHYHCMLQSTKEAVVYLHTQDFGMTVPAGMVLTLHNLDLSDGEVELWILKPQDSTTVKSTEIIRGSSLEVLLPEFCEDICVYVVKK